MDNPGQGGLRTNLRVIMLKWLILLPLVVITAFEVWLLLTFGQLLGVFWSMVWMVGSLLLGVVLLRLEGIMVLLKIHQQLLKEQIPAQELLDMLFIGLGSIFLILPGFFTDLLGLTMLIPPIRWSYRSLTLRILRKMIPSGTVIREAVTPSDEVIDITPDK